jgi:chromatin remodeling complex protein RSC6
LEYFTRPGAQARIPSAPPRLIFQWLDVAYSDSERPRESATVELADQQRLSAIPAQPGVRLINAVTVGQGVERRSTGKGFHRAGLQSAILRSGMLRPIYTAGVFPLAKTETQANSAFMKSLKPSPELAAIVGADPLPRTEATKRLWDYIKQHNLQNPANKRNILCDGALKAVMGKDEVTMFEMTGLVSKHLA